MKPIAETKANQCDHVETRQVKNLAGKEETRYCCEYSTENATYSKPCTMYDWVKCTFNEDK